MDNYKARMKYIDMKLEQKWTVQSSKPKEQIQEIPQTNIICLQDEDKNFKEEFNRVIDNKHLKDVKATLNDVDTTNAK